MLRYGSPLKLGTIQPRHAGRREHLAADLGVARLVGLPHRVAVQARAEHERGHENDQEECRGERGRSRHGVCPGAGTLAGRWRAGKRAKAWVARGPTRVVIEDAACRRPRPGASSSRLPRPGAASCSAPSGCRFDLAPADLDEEALGSGMVARGVGPGRRGGESGGRDSRRRRGAGRGHHRGPRRRRLRQTAVAGRGASHAGVAARARPRGHHRRRGARSGRRASRRLPQHVRMRDYTAAEIDAYVAGRWWAGQGGRLRHPGRRPSGRSSPSTGCWCNVMGLPLWTVLRLLDDAGCRAPRRPDEAFARCASCPLQRDGGSEVASEARWAGGAWAAGTCSPACPSSRE